jgi:hypothetical protein
MSEFRKYNTIIEVDERDKISKWISHHPHLKTDEYVATEKIDGANFGVHISPNKKIEY